MKNFTAVVPCYNVENYLPRFFSCLDAQWCGRDDYEVIFVNDGSTDGTARLLEDYVQQNTAHHKLITHAQNQGISAARNSGLEAAEGTWITFPDADDVLADGAYGYLMEHFLDNTADMVCFQTKWLTESDDYNPHAPISGKVVWEGSGFELLDQHLTITAWSNLYRVKKIREFGMNFPHIAAAEDTLFNTTLLAHNIKVRRVDTLAYFYIKHMNSSMRHFDNAKLHAQVDAMLYGISQLQQIVGEGGQDIQASIRPYVKSFVVNSIGFLLLSEHTCTEVTTIRKEMEQLGAFPFSIDNKLQWIFSMLLQYPWLLHIARPIYQHRLKRKLKG